VVRILMVPRQMAKSCSGDSKQQNEWCYQRRDQYSARDFWRA
jgi:hypothetical protein